jgi:hypothetical protein
LFQVKNAHSKIAYWRWVVSALSIVAVLAERAPQSPLVGAIEDAAFELRGQGVGSLAAASVNGFVDAVADRVAALISPATPTAPSSNST